MVSAVLKPRLSGLALIAGSLFALPVLANPVLPGLTNLNFLQYTGTAPKAAFTAVNPVGWTGGSGLIYIDTPGTSTTSPTTACGSTYLQTYGCPSTLNIPGGYNEVQADGNPTFESGFNYTVTGLTPGQTYSLSFYQAASQQTGFTGATTEQWLVSLGTGGINVCAGCAGGGNSTYSSADPNGSLVATTLMNTPSQGLVDWNYVTVNLTADSTTDVLSFLAWGDNGNTENLPPIVFLAGVDDPSGLNAPEPGALALLSAGLAGLGLVARRYRKNRA